MRGLHVHGPIERYQSVQTGLSRRYLSLGHDGRAYRYVERGRFEEIPFEEALNSVAESLTEMGETPETPYDEEYRARRSAALRPARWRELRVQIQPEKVAIH